MSKILGQSNTTTRYVSIADEYDNMSQANLANMRQCAIDNFRKSNTRKEKVENALAMRVASGVLNTKYGTSYDIPDLESMVGNDFSGLDKEMSGRIRGDHSVESRRRLPDCPAFEDDGMDGMEL